jgi:CBS domain-containing protein
MTADPITVPASAAVLHAARLMKEQDIGDVIVVDDGQIRGIVTDRDLVTRVLGENLDPSRTPVGEVCSRELVTVAPDDAPEQAIELMRARALRRIPVTRDGQAIGIVSMGDLAVERDPESALADISAAPPND